MKHWGVHVVGTNQYRNHIAAIPSTLYHFWGDRRPTVIIVRRRNCRFQGIVFRNLVWVMTMRNGFAIMSRC
jgi:hypothetical protein